MPAATNKENFCNVKSSKTVFPRDVGQVQGEKYMTYLISWLM